MEIQRDLGLQKNKKKHNNELRWILMICLFGLALNLFFNSVVSILKLPLYLDTVGTILTAYLGGPLSGILVALLTNFILGFGNSESIYFGVLNVIIAVIASVWLQEKKRRRSLWSMGLFVFVLACVGGGIGACQTWVFDGFYTDGANGSLILFFYEKCGFNEFWAQFCAAFLYDILDKALSVVAVYVVVRLMPIEVRRKLRFSGWLQTPLDNDEITKIKKMKKQSFSLGTKIVTVLMITFSVIAVVVVVISLTLFRQFSEDQHGLIAAGVAELAASVVDGDMVEEYLEKGENVPGYAQTKARLAQIQKSYKDVDYVYVYQIKEDGCHVVFDLDTEEVPGDPVGSVIEFDPSFMPYLDSLLKGERIETIISDDKYGWLLTEYEPIYDHTGKCVCYAAADVSMSDIKVYEYDFLMKLASLFLGFFAFLLAIGVWLSTYHLVYPINTMAYVANSFNYDSEEARKDNVERLQRLDIHTKDEIENLYNAFLKTTEDSEKNFADLNQKTQVLSLLQSGLIMVLADIVENRDQSTGDHIRKTAAYVKIILEKMRENGYDKVELTDEYIQDVV
ncbi:MAG: ECF transporter S component, partial [Lachnospiraceae bacterium]|nr:ECF transporter S component [Lachnospiraceae bacterium]